MILFVQFGKKLYLCHGKDNQFINNSIILFEYEQERDG